MELKAYEWLVVVDGPKVLSVKAYLEMFEK